MRWIVGAAALLLLGVGYIKYIGLCVMRVENVGSSAVSVAIDGVGYETAPREIQPGRAKFFLYYPALGEGAFEIICVDEAAGTNNRFKGNYITRWFNDYYVIRIDGCSSVVSFERRL